MVNHYQSIKGTNGLTKYVHSILIDISLHDRHILIWSTHPYMINTSLYDRHILIWSTHTYMIDTYLYDWHILMWSTHPYMIDTSLYDRHIFIWSTHLYMILYDLKVQQMCLCCFFHFESLHELLKTISNLFLLASYHSW